MLDAIDIFFGVVFFVFGLYVTIRLNNTRSKLDELEWIARTQRANVLVFFLTENVTHYRDHYTSINDKTTIAKTEQSNRLVVKNVGSCEARDIKVSLKNVNGLELNRASGFVFFRDLKPINILAPGLEMSYPYTLTMDADIEDITGHWIWTNPDGSIDEVESNLDILGQN